MRTRISVLVVSLLASVVTVVGSSDPARANVVPAGPATCAATGAGSNSCGVSDQTGTSLTLTFSGTLSTAHPRCDGTTGPNQGQCTYVVALGYGGGNGVSTSQTCDWGTAGSYSPPLTSSTVSCTVHASWSSTTYPTILNASFVEQGGGGTDYFGDGSHGFKVTIPRPAPVVDFTVTADQTTSGLYHFVAHETTYSPVTEYHWLLDDNGFGDNATTDHTFTQAGTHSVTLHVVDSNHQSTDRTKSIDVSVSDLTASVVITAPDGSPFTGGVTGVGQQVTATVTLAEKAGAAHPVTGITVDGGGMTWTPSAAVSSGSIPTPAPPTSLSPGQSASYSSTFTVQRSGKATVSVTAHAAEDSTSVTATASASARLAQPLTVTETFLQGGNPVKDSAITLADDDRGELPQDVQLRLDITNTSSDPQTQIQVQPLDLKVVDPASFHLPFPMDVASGPTPATVPDLQPGDQASVTFTLHVTGNQDFHLTDLIVSGNGSTSASEISFADGVLHARPTALLLIDQHLDDSNPTHIRTGRPIGIDARVTNLSNTQSLELEPVIPRFRGNGGGQASVNGAVPTADGFVPPVVGPLDQHSDKPYHVLVQTIVNGGTRLELTLDPHGKVVSRDGTKAELRADQIRLTSGTTPLTVHLDDSDPLPEQLDGATAAYIFTASALEGLRDWCANGFDAIADFRSTLSSVGGGIVAAGGIAVKDAEGLGVAASFVKAELGLNVFWSVLSDQQKRQFAEEVALDTDSANDAWKQFHGAVDQGVLNYFQGFQDAFQKGDTARAMDILGGKVGYAVPEALATFVPGVILGKVARGLGWGLKAAGAIKTTTIGRVISLAEKIKTSGIVLNNRKVLQGVEIGQNLMADGAKVLVKQFGLRKNDIRVISQWAQKRGLIIALRQRNPISVTLLESGRFVEKSELIKIKNVDEIDKAFLGYRSSDYGTVILKSPDKLKDVKTRLFLAKADADETAAVLARYEARVKEWDEYEKVYKGYAEKGYVDRGFDLRSQGAGGRDPLYRRFAMEKVRTHGSEYYRLRMGDNSGGLGTLRYITGDIDIVAILTADGRMASGKVRAQLYKDFMNTIGMQHGESLSWIFKGEFFSTKQAKFIADHVPTQEILAAFGPDGLARAVYFDPHLTAVNTATGDTVATFVGGYSTALQKVGRYVSIKLNKLR